MRRWLPLAMMLSLGCDDGPTSVDEPEDAHAAASDVGLDGGAGDDLGPATDRGADHDLAPLDMGPADLTPLDMALDEVGPLDDALPDMTPSDMAPPDGSPFDLSPFDLAPPDLSPPDLSPPDMAPLGPHPCGEGFPLRLTGVDYPAVIGRRGVPIPSTLTFEGDPRLFEGRAMVATRLVWSGITVTSYFFRAEVTDDCEIHFDEREPEPDQPPGDGTIVFRVIDRPPPPPFPEFDPPASNDLVLPVRID